MFVFFKKLCFSKHVFGHLPTLIKSLSLVGGWCLTVSSARIPCRAPVSGHSVLPTNRLVPLLAGCLRLRASRLCELCDALGEHEQQDRTSFKRHQFLALCIDVLKNDSMPTTFARDASAASSADRTIKAQLLKPTLPHTSHGTSCHSTYQQWVW